MLKFLPILVTLFSLNIFAMECNTQVIEVAKANLELKAKALGNDIHKDVSINEISFRITQENFMETVYKINGNIYWQPYFIYVTMDKMCSVESVEIVEMH